MPQVEFAHYFCSKVAQYVSPIRGALVHGLRHTYATELTNSEVSEHTLMKLLDHESMDTSQRYVAGPVLETRAAADKNPLYELVIDRLTGGTKQTVQSGPSPQR